MGCARVLESLGHFGANATADAGNELDEKRCLHLESLKYPYYVVAKAKTGCEKPNSQHLLAKLELATADLERK